MPKTSDLAGSKKRPEWLSPAQLAQLQRCSERTIREWGKKGRITEGYQPKGGHAPIRMPLSGRTRAWLHRRSGGWPFDDNAGDWQGEWTDDFAEWLMLAQLYQRDLEEGDRKSKRLHSRQ